MAASRKGIVRNPVRSETDAFRLTIAAVALIVISTIIGWLANAWAGVAVFVVVGLVASVLYLRSDRTRGPALRGAAREPHRDRVDLATRRVLVVANEELAGDELHERILGDSDGAAVELDILAPIVASRAHVLTSDIDEERRDAERRLRRSLDWARRHGLSAHGEVGDATPDTALEDELRAFGADEVIVVSGGRPEAGRQARMELERLRAELPVPVVQVLVTARR